MNLRQVVEAVLTLLRFSACLKTVRHGVLPTDIYHLFVSVTFRGTLTVVVHFSPKVRLKLMGRCDVHTALI